MLFWIIIIITVVMPTIWYLGERWRVDNLCIVGCIGSILAFFGLFFCIAVWAEYANTVSKIIAQEAIIEVYQERVDTLSQRLEHFNYPEKPHISLDADTPWASIVTSLSEAESQLAEARKERAVALRSIEALRMGPMSGVMVLINYEGVKQ